MIVTFKRLGQLIFETNYPIRADQFSGVSISIKSSKICNNSLYLRAYDLKDKNKIINIDNENKWKTYRFSFEKLDIENNTFNGIILYYYNITNEPLEIYIGNIELIGKKNVPDAGVCFEIDEDKGIIPSEVIPTNHNNTIMDNYTDIIHDTEINNDTEISNDIEISNDTEIISNIENYTFVINVNILDITLREETLNIIQLNCESFNKINDENLNLLFSSKDNLNSFQTETCILPNTEMITSFSCKLPDFMPNDEYKILSPPNNKYFINYSKNIIVKDGIISFFNDNVDTTKINTMNETDEFTEITSSKIIITNSIKQIINKEKEIYFQIVPMNSTNYFLENNEIIFVDSNKTKYLYLKDCQQFINNNMINGIKCIISNNILKANYTDLADGQNISIFPDQINFIVINSTGGFLSDDILITVDTNLSSAEINNFDLTFNILYYNSTIKPGYLFPHKVYLYGVKKITRNLEEKKYDYEVLFPNCTTGNYSEIDSNAIGSIRCNLPDFMPAGIYTKLKSNGFDINPKSKINIFLQNDFNRYYSKEENGTSFQPYSHSSNSMTLIICIVNGVLAVFMILLIICYCRIKRKRKRNKENDISSNDITNMKSKSNINNTTNKSEK